MLYIYRVQFYLNQSCKKLYFVAHVKWYNAASSGVR